ncbi:hypothetical protein EDB81DRAFT_882694 [Dactylonectria macrodidyma]|uniref:Cell wall protein PhiA n=1 Tax=Dactylonectria macrodidyma TaxID=307937 RepID=A0A9P9EZ67_9HYPO|nr:hypothetical protein EDB81DRAFT_882694 [Dactylonectria macrodidyma]
MQIKAILLAPLLATGLVSAAPSTKYTTFEVMALRSASPIHFSILQAADNGFYTHLPNQGAKCHTKSDNAVTFKLVGDQLYLYKSSGTAQKVWVDRSGMGQGIMGYNTGTSKPKNGEFKGWKVDKNGALSFKGQGLIACPGAPHDSWSIWVDAGVSNPGGNKGCLGFSARTLKIKKPNSCKYTEQK